MNPNTGNPLFSAERWSLVRNLLDKLSEMSPEHQALELERIRVDDAELAASVRALLEGTRRGTTPSVQSVFERLLPPESMPASIGPFRLLERIGAGGMGVVYLAERSGADFTQRVALKLLDGDAARMSRLAARERRILAALAHPNITAFIDAGSENGRAWLAMEYVDGKPLHDYCQHKGFDTRDRVRLFDQVCAAVAHAHSQLVVHRDLKPSNVLVATDGTAKLLDFGIALVLDPSDEQMPATRVFTPEYAAPEQLRGERATTATDVYGLGLLLYELVCGKRLPTLERSGGDAEWTTAELAHHATTTTQQGVQAASTQSEPKTLSRLLRGDLGRIIAHALASKPALRYASVALLREDLSRWLDHRPLTLARPGLSYTIGRFVRRNRFTVAAAAVALAALLALTATAMWQAHERRLEAERAVAQTRRATAMQTFLSDVINEADPNQNGGQPITPLQLIGKGEALVGRFDAEPALQADVLTQLGQLYIGNSDYERAKALLDRALKLSESPDTPADVRARVLGGVSEISTGNSKYDDSLVYARQGLALLEADPHADPKAIASMHVHVAQALDGIGDSAELERFLRGSLAQDRAELGDNNDKSVAEEWVLLGWTLGVLNHFDEAEDAFSHGITAYRTLYGNDGFDVGHALNELSIIQSRANRIDAAEQTTREVLRIYRAAVGPNHRKTLSAEHNLLVLMERRGHIVEALPQREQLEARAAGPGMSTPRQLANGLQWMGYDYSQLGRFADAEATLRKSLELGAQAGGAHDNVTDNNSRRELGVILTATGRYDDAEKLLRDALAIALAQKPPDPPTARALKGAIGDVLRLRHRYADALVLAKEATDFAASTSATSGWRPLTLAERSEAELDAGDPAAAEVSARSALEYAHKAYPADDFRNAFALYALARVCLARGQAGEAEPLLRDALKLRSPPHPATHPRVLEVEVALAQALAAQGKHEQARALAAEIRPRLQASPSPYAADLLARLGTP
jgi:eukaryotic-like serine/threonine-protein kinase